MATGTTLVDVKKAIVAGLGARAGLSGVQISYADPRREVQRESIWLRSTRAALAIRTMKAGTKHYQEDYDLELVLQVLKPNGDTQQTTEERADVLVGEIQQYFAETPQVHADIQYAEVVGWEHQTPSESLPEGAARFVFQIRVHARLTS